MESRSALLMSEQDLLRLLALGDVAGDAEGADDVSALVSERHLGGGYPALPAIEPADQFFLPDQRPAGANDLLLVGHGALGILLGEEVKIGLAHDLCRIVKMESIHHGFVDAEETAGGVFEVDAVRQIVHERVEQVAL